MQNLKFKIGDYIVDIYSPEFFGLCKIKDIIFPNYYFVVVLKNEESVIRLCEHYQEVEKYYIKIYDKTQYELLYK